MATLARVGDRRVATGKDFDAQNGALKNPAALLLDQRPRGELLEAVQANVPWQVTSVEQKPGAERPAPPFTTSTLTQEASRKLGFSTERTMQVAQRLFQGVDVGKGQEGLITYHRTDSTTLSEKALTESSKVIGEMFGAEYYDGPRRYQTRVKNAQEAHEAIRPSDFRLDAEPTGERARRRRLQGLRPDLEAGHGVADGGCPRAAHLHRDFRQGDRTTRWPSSPPAARRSSSPGSAARTWKAATTRPPSWRSRKPSCRSAASATASTATARAVTLVGTESKRHETTPPARFTEASLIKELERLGIGRPSTYAPTIATIVRRGYVFRQSKALVPSFTAFAVTKLLRDHFGDFVETDFTAEMEDDLDEISRGERESSAFLKQFYFGDKKHRGLLTAAEQGAEKADYPVLDLGKDEDSGDMVRVRVGRFGPFVQLGKGGPGHTASLPEDVAPADLTVERALELVRAKAEGPRTIGTDPATGMPVFVMNGRYGAYVQLGGDAGGQESREAEARLAAGGDDGGDRHAGRGLKLLSLPRTVGTHPDDGAPILANFGRFGPYLKHNDEFRSLETEEDVFTVDLDRAVGSCGRRSSRGGGSPRRRRCCAS